MKYFSFLITLAVVFAQVQTHAQSPNEQVIDITFNKTTSMVFPTVIKSVDRGSRDILAQKAKGVENILQLKAAHVGFFPTNLTVITGDGAVHEFTVTYSKDPAQRIIQVTPPGTNSPAAVIFQSHLTETQLEQAATRVINNSRRLRHHRETLHKIGLALHGIYIESDIIFYRVHLANKSNINYDVEFMRFYVEDKQKVKRTASQEVEITPVHIAGDVTSIPGNTARDVVFALEKFTIPDAKRLVLELFEKNGGRHLKLYIRNRTIVRARPIPKSNLQPLTSNI